MLHALCAKLEIDVMQAKEIEEAVDLAVTHCMPALVVHQDLVTNTFFYRGRRQGKFKIIVPVDWPKGNASGSMKFRDVPIHVLQHDGFEILLSPAKHTGGALSELSAICSMVKKYINPFAELRICLEAMSRPEEEWLPYVEALPKVIPPDVIRTDHNNSTTRANAANHTSIVSKITANAKWPVKLSGNITLKSALECGCARYGVSLKQAKDIIQELKDTPSVENKATSVVAPSV